MAGVEAIVAEGFERIHRTNLVGMGVLPLQFKDGVNRKTLELDGTELYDVIGDITPGADLALVITRANGDKVDVPVTCRLDTEDEVHVYKAGGVLQRFAQDFLAIDSAITEQDMDSKMQSQIKVPATYMRGGTSKGVFFNLEDMPQPAQVAGEARDKLLLRVIGSPDPYAKQIDGMGGATSSTSKTVVVSRSQRVDHDVDYLFGQVSIDKPFVDWSGNCGNLSAAVGPFAIHAGLIDQDRIPQNGIVTVRVWQVNIGKTILIHVPIVNGFVQETGAFELDGVTFPAAEIKLISSTLLMVKAACFQPAI